MKDKVIPIHGQQSRVLDMANQLIFFLAPWCQIAPFQNKFLLFAKQK